MGWLGVGQCGWANGFPALVGRDPERVPLSLSAPAPSIPWEKQYPLLLRSSCRPNWGSKSSASLQQVLPVVFITTECLALRAPWSVVAEPGWGDSRLGGQRLLCPLPTGLYVLVGAGALMMAVGFFGCCGAMRESQCVLGSVSGAPRPREGGIGLQGAGPGRQRQLLLRPAETSALAPSP